MPKETSLLEDLPLRQRWVVILAVLLGVFGLWFYLRGYTEVLSTRYLRQWVGAFLSLSGAFGTMAFTAELKGRDGKPHVAAAIAGSLIGIAIIAGAETLAHRVPHADTTPHYIARNAVAFLFLAGAPWAAYFGSRD